MRAVVQRVREAAVEVEGSVVSSIGRGLLVLLGVGRDDGPADVRYVAGKILDLRVFDDEQGRMNRAVGEVGGAVLVVSQFTLYGDARKGRRPSFDQAAPPDLGRELYEAVAHELAAADLPVRTGVFGAVMQVRLVNDGPVTILLDSRRSF
jgi:D-tyrosyl-tRNA(Tyr) deacylase